MQIAILIISSLTFILVLISLIKTIIDYNESKRRLKLLYLKEELENKRRIHTIKRILNNYYGKHIRRY